MYTKTKNYSWRYRYIKKTWIPTVVVPHIEALALPFSIEQQREAHAEYKIYSPCYTIKVRVCAYAYTQRTYQINTRGITLYPVGHLSLLSSDRDVKFARFQCARTERNKRLFNMSRKPRLGIWSRYFGFPRGDTSHPLPPGVELSGAKVLHFFELCKRNRLLGRFF